MASGSEMKLVPKGYSNKWMGEAYGKCNEKRCSCKSYIHYVSSKTSKCATCAHAAVQHLGIEISEEPTIQRIKVGTEFVQSADLMTLPEQYKIRTFNGKENESFEFYVSRVRAQLEAFGFEIVLSGIIRGLNDKALAFYENLPYDYSPTPQGIDVMRVDFGKKFPAPPDEYFKAKAITEPLKEFANYPTWIEKFDRSCDVMGIQGLPKKGLLLRLVEKAYGKPLIRTYTMDVEELKKFFMEKSRSRIAKANKNSINGAKIRQCRYLARPGGCTRQNCPFKHYVERVNQEQMTGEHGKKEQESTSAPYNHKPTSIRIPRKLWIQGGKKEKAEKQEQVPSLDASKKEKTERQEQVPSPSASKIPPIRIPQELWSQQASKPAPLNGKPKIHKELKWKEAKEILLKNMEPDMAKKTEIQLLLEEFKEVFDLDPFCSKVSTKIEPIKNWT